MTIPPWAKEAPAKGADADPRPRAQAPGAAAVAQQLSGERPAAPAARPAPGRPDAAPVGPPLSGEVDVSPAVRGPSERLDAVPADPRLSETIDAGSDAGGRGRFPSGKLDAVAGGRRPSGKLEARPRRARPPGSGFVRLGRVLAVVALALAVMGTALLVFALVRNASASAELARAHEECGPCCAKVIEVQDRKAAAHPR